MKNQLDAILCSRGLRWREQCGLQPNWGLRQPSVMDLSPEALKSCRSNPKNYCRKQLKNGNILFPAADFDAPFELHEPEFPAKFTASVPADDPFYARLARKMGGVPVPDTRPLAPDEPAVIFGHSAENRHACRLAVEQRIFASGVCPGKGGWSLELPPGPVSRAVVCCDEGSEKAFLKHWEKSRTPRFAPGPGAPAVFRNPEELLRTQVSTIIPGENFSDFVEKISGAFDCGGPKVGKDNGHCTVAPLVKSYYAWVFTGDRRFLEAFKEIFFALVRYYLTLPGGASYISDYDFYLGSLVNCFAAAETDPLFTAEDRLLGAAFLLSSFRLIEKYGKSYWPMREGALRFNHETFPAMSCYWGARYFGENYSLREEARRWKFYAETAFAESNLSRVWRQKENSGDYQWIVPSQKLQWDLAEKGKPSPAFKQMSSAIAFVTDNSGRQAGYGDSAPLSGAAHKDMLQSLAQVSKDGLAAKLSAKLDSNGTSFLPIPGWGLYLHPAPVSPEGPLQSPGWHLEKLAPHILRRFPEAVKSKYDKAVYRDDARYLLFEPCSCDSHRHYDTGAILLYQAGKHYFLVDNGYGFDARTAPKNMVDAYSSREVGPNCHNMVILRDKAGKVIRPPEFSLFRRKGNTLFCELAFAGVLWKREVTVTPRGLRIIDTVEKTGPGEAVAAECQFDTLGRTKLEPGLWRIAQKGAKAELRFADSSGVASCEGAYLTRGWKSALEKVYPYASGDVKQLRRSGNLKRKGATLRFESELVVLD